MKATEITDHMVVVIESGKYQFLRWNNPNVDMVGHTGNYVATLIGVESAEELGMAPTSVSRHIKMPIEKVETKSSLPFCGKRKYN